MRPQLTVGQKVICVDDLPRPPSLRTDEAIPTKGCVYHVREIVPLKHLGADDDGLLVGEIVNPRRLYVTPAGEFTCELSFRVSRFRPAPSIDVFRKVLEKAGQAPVERVSL